VKAERRAHKVIMDFPAWAPPAAVVAACAAVVEADVAVAAVAGKKRKGSMSTSIQLRDLARHATLGLVVGTALLHAAPIQRTFATPQEAIQATIEAAERNDSAALLQLFGPGGKDIVESGDPAQDKDLRAEFARSAHEKLQIEQDPSTPDRVEFTVGEQEWPFPVPVVRMDGKWQMDAAGGRLEILARRIGRNELNAMEVCRGYAEAQMEYASGSHDTDHVLKYAQRIASTAGQQDGLYSDATADSLVSLAFAEATQGNVSTMGLKPYHGYFFRALTAQGAEATGGAFGYVVNGKMIGGFALVAWPAEYGVSGIQTLIINHQGVVYEKDLGPSTVEQARRMMQFNPDKSWRPVVLE
jgi:hypothetical protein